MKKAIVVLLLLIGAYTAFWFYEASEIEKQLKEELASLEPNAKIQYDAIQKRGYPLSIKLAVVNPRVEVENEAVNFTVQGQLAGCWSLLGELKKLDLSGNSHLEFEVGEEGDLTDYKFTGDMVVEFDSIRTIGDKGKITFTNAKAYSSGNLVHGPFEWTIDGLTADYDVKSPNPNRSHLFLDVEVKGAELASIKNAEESPLTRMYQLLINSIEEKSGKTDLSFLMQCELPSQELVQKYIHSPLLLFTESFPTISLDLKKFSSSNALVKQDAKAAITISEDGKRSLVLRIDADGFVHYYPGYHEAVVSAIDKVKLEAAQWDAPEDLSLLKSVLLNHTDLIKSLVPHPENFGKIEGEESLLFVLNKTNLNWHIALEKLNLHCDLFGVGIKADAQERNNSTHIDAIVTITHVKRLAEELVAFYNRLERLASLIEEETNQHLTPLPENAPEKIVAYLNLLATKREGDELAIDIKYSDGKIQVGPLSLEQARAQLEQLWEGLMPPQPSQPQPHAP